MEPSTCIAWGVIRNTYHVNLYGELPDELNAGIPSDRCQVDWWLTSGRAKNAARIVRWAPRGAAQTPAPAHVGRC